MKKETIKKKNNWKTIIGIIFLVLLIITIVSITSLKFIESKENNAPSQPKEEIKYNTNEEIVKDKDINGILFTNIECSYDGTNSLLKYTIVNHTSETIHLGEYEVMVKDKDGNLLAILSPNLNQDIEPEGSFDTGNAINIDLSTAYSMELVLDQNEGN